MMRNPEYSHEGMLLTLNVRLKEAQLIANRIYVLRDRITPGPDRPDAMYKAEELESDLDALSKDVRNLADSLDRLRDYTMYPPNRRSDWDYTTYSPNQTPDPS